MSFQLKGFLLNNFLASVDMVTYVPIYNAASAWPHTFLHPGCFCLAYYFKNKVCIF